MQTTRPEDALLTDAFADFLEKCRAKNLSEKTLNIYTVHFKFFREYLSDPDKKASDITEDTLEGFILYLQNRGCNDITVQSYMRGVRCFCYYLMEEGYLQRFKIKLPKADKRIKETYTDTELKKLLKKPNVKTCEFNEYKTWVFSNYLLATGNRISTVLSLQIKDLDFENETIQLNKCKNRKAQIVPMASSLKVILKEYLTYRKGSPDDYVFCNSYGGKGDIRSYQEMLAKYGTTSILRMAGQSLSLTRWRSMTVSTSSRPFPRKNVWRSGIIGMNGRIQNMYRRRTKPFLNRSKSSQPGGRNAGKS